MVERLFAMAQKGAGSKGGPAAEDRLVAEVTTLINAAAVVR